MYKSKYLIPRPLPVGPEYEAKVKGHQLCAHVVVRSTTRPILQFSFVLQPYLAPLILGPVAMAESL